MWTEEEQRQAGALTAIVDLDGFYIRGNFVVKEMGWKTVGSNRSYAVHFYYRGNVAMTEQDQRTNRWVLNNVYDIPWDKYWFGMIYSDKLMDVVKAFYPGDGVVAYKGGHFEKDVLNAAGIPHYNLEDLGCPKVDDIKRSRYPVVMPDCGHHKHGHCPQEEVEWMACWLEEQCWNQGMCLPSSPLDRNPMDYLNLECFAY